MLRVTRTALFLIGMALVRRHQRPQVGAVGRSGTGNVAGSRTSSREAATTSVARAPAMPSPTRPAQPTKARARARSPAQLPSAPAQMKRAVAIACQTMFWKASSPAIQAVEKARTVPGSRLMGR